MGQTEPPVNRLLEAVRSESHAASLLDRNPDRRTAANGDELHLVHRGTFSLVMGPDGLTSAFDMTWVVIGGTGRFAGATGSGTTHGSSLLSTGITAASYQGDIAY